jgi:hypothetical protein
MSDTISDVFVEEVVARNQMDEDELVSNTKLVMSNG